jgi:hypothetical protein
VSNVLSEDKKQQVIALGQLGWSLRRIEATVHIRRETISGYLRAAAIPIRPPGRVGTAHTCKNGHRHLYDDLFNLRLHPILQNGFAPADLLQGQLAAFLIQFLKAIEAIPGVAHDLAGLREITAQNQRTFARLINYHGIVLDYEIPPTSG